MSRLSRVFYGVWILILSQACHPVIAQTSWKKLLNPSLQPLYSGSDSTEAELTFTHWVEMTSSRSPSLRQAELQVHQQVEHLFGPMEQAEVKAVPKGDHTLNDIRVEKMEAGRFKIHYSYSGTIVLEKGPRTKYSFVLPINPDEIYEAGRVGRRYPCTDHHYQAEGDFWYFWNPANEGCPLVEGKDYLVVTGQVKRLQNTKRSYPEYDRLVDREGDITVTLLMGMDEPHHAKDPNVSKDINAENFRDIKAALDASGYESKKMSAADIRNWVGATVSPTPYVEEFTKTLKKARVVVRVFFGPTGIDQRSAPFHFLFKEALENSSIMMYDGHSGLGGHLDLETIEAERGFRIQPNQKRYQIYFFNSCSSYTYYNSMFFDRKITSADPKGTRNLDILTNGLATYFSVMHETNMALLRAVEQWADGGARISYQALAKQIDSDNLFGVNGDRDNP